jgi:DNA replication protein DnaC
MINEVLDQLVYLKLKSAHLYLKELHINDAISQSELKGLNKVLRKEVEAKEENNKLYNVKVAAFPFIRKIEDYDFSFQPTVDENKIKNLIASNFYFDATNVVFIGNPGVGNYRKFLLIERNERSYPYIGISTLISFDNTPQ